MYKTSELEWCDDFLQEEAENLYYDKIYGYYNEFDFEDFDNINDNIIGLLEES